MVWDVAMSKERHFTDQELKLLEKKKKFLISEEMYEDIKLMDDSEITFFMYSIFEYVIHGVLPELDGKDQRLVKSSFNRFIKQHKENLDGWLHERMQKIEAGRKGGLAKGKK